MTKESSSDYWTDPMWKEEPPKFGDVRDTWSYEADTAAQGLLAYPVSEFFDNPSVYAPFGFSAADKKRYGTVVRVPISSLTPTQDSVLVRGLEYKLRNPSSEPANVPLYTDGRLLLADHTRVVAEVVKGKDEVDVLVIKYVGGRQKFEKLTQKEVE